MDRLTRLFTRRPLPLISLFVAISLSGLTWVFFKEDLLSSYSVSRSKFLLGILSIDALALLFFSFWLFRIFRHTASKVKETVPGGRLHRRLVALFALLAFIPSGIMVIFSAVFFYFGLQSWFQKQIQTAFKESLEVAQTYLAEHQEDLRKDVALLASDLAAALLTHPGVDVSTALTTLAQARGINEALVFNSQNQILGRSSLAIALSSEFIPDDFFIQAQAGEIPLLVESGGNRVRVLKRMDMDLLGAVSSPWYLYVGRIVDPQVLGHLKRTEDAVSEYYLLKESQTFFLGLFLLVFGSFALILVLGAMIIALHWANRLMQPIGALMAGAEEVGQGKFSVKIETRAQDSELRQLIASFNTMATRISEQRSLLLERQIFISSVLEGVWSGVLGCDEKHLIKIANRSALHLLKITEEEILGKPLSQILSFSLPLEGSVVPKESHVRLTEGGMQKTFHVRIAPQKQADGTPNGFVVTFDDITRQLSDQRKAAWADVARRIAHEIKNPLTPVQLAMERLRRKFSSQISVDQEGFQRCLETIARQVDSIKTLVAEFSSFARMPAPVFVQENLQKIIEESVLLQKTAHPEIEFQVKLPSEPILWDIDGGQIRQILTNGILNALDAIAERKDSDPEIKGIIEISLLPGPKIQIQDNGAGLPQAGRERLMEPYFTTRKHGTGLGLAITQKIMQDHDGFLELEDRIDGPGATLTLSFTAL